MFICVFSSTFYLLYFIFDQLFYHHADVVKILNVKIIIYNKSLSRIKEHVNEYNYNSSRKNSLMSLIFNENLKSEELLINKLFNEALIRLPLLFVLLPQAIKFYVLIVFYPKFRHELSLLFRVRFYLDLDLAKEVKLFGSKKISTLNVKYSLSKQNSSELKSDEENFKSIERVDSVEIKTKKNKFVEVRHQFDAFCCFNISKSKRRKNLKKESTQLSGIKNILLDFDSEQDNSSIIGYKSAPITSNFNQTLF